jgi:hypothetical protein
MQRKLILPALAVFALAACDKTATGVVGDALSDSDVQAVVGTFGDQDGAFLDGFGGPSFNRIPDGPQLTTTVTTTFTRTRNCPGGGDVKLEGTHVVTADPATHSGSVTFNATRTEEACALQHNGVTITITGTPNTALTANQSWSNGTPGVRTATKKGSFSWSTSKGKTGSCSVDVTHTWDPATHTLHVVGQVCNRTIDLTRTWTQS